MSLSLSALDINISCTRSDEVAAMQVAFSKSDAATLLGILDLYGVEPHERKRARAVGYCCAERGGEDRLLHFVHAVKTDCRDVLLWQASGPLSAAEGQKLLQDVRRLPDQWGS